MDNATKNKSIKYSIISLIGSLTALSSSCFVIYHGHSIVFLILGIVFLALDTILLITLGVQKLRKKLV